MKTIAEIISTSTTFPAACGYNNSSQISALEYYQSLCDRENRMEGNLHYYDGLECQLCKNKGYIMVPREYGDDYEVVQKNCKCTKARKSIRALKRSGLETVIDKYTFDKFIAKEDWQKELLNKAKSYVCENNNAWFFIGGQSGCGKTHLCSAIAIELLKQGREVKYMLWREDARKLKIQCLRAVRK